MCLFLSQWKQVLCYIEDLSAMNSHCNKKAKLLTILIANYRHFRFLTMEELCCLLPRNRERPWSYVVLDGCRIFSIDINNATIDGWFQIRVGHTLHLEKDQEHNPKTESEKKCGVSKFRSNNFYGIYNNGKKKVVENPNGSLRMQRGVTLKKTVLYTSWIHKSPRTIKRN